ncbi:hypothetical protein CRYUN_Cryun35bG0046900 [Craigia yunnanensis]
MKGDYHRYLAEFKTGDDRKAAAENTFIVYRSAQHVTLQASNAYLQFLQGPDTKMLLEFVKEMPKSETKLRIDLSSLLGTLFFTWVILQLFPEPLDVVHVSKEDQEDVFAMVTTVLC